MAPQFAAKVPAICVWATICPTMAVLFCHLMGATYLDDGASGAVGNASTLKMAPAALVVLVGTASLAGIPEDRLVPIQIATPSI